MEPTLSTSTSAVVSYADGLFCLFVVSSWCGQVHRHVASDQPNEGSSRTCAHHSQSLFLSPPPTETNGRSRTRHVRPCSAPFQFSSVPDKDLRLRSLSLPFNGGSRFDLSSIHQIHLHFFFFFSFFVKFENCQASAARFEAIRRRARG